MDGSAEDRKPFGSKVIWGVKMSDEMEVECDYEGHDWGDYKKHVDDVWEATCRRCGESTEEYVDVEYWDDLYIGVAGRFFRALKAWGNHSFCSYCCMPIFGMPLILYSADGVAAITFHFNCAKTLKILDMLRDNSAQK